MKNILVSAISYVNSEREGSEIYTTFAKRLINDVLTKTPYDIMVTTNAPSHFDDEYNNNPNRVIITENKLENHKTHVGAFNQLLKFSAIKDINQKYDWVLYLDCDAGLNSEVNTDVIDSKINEWESNGFDMLVLLANRTYEWAENQYLETIKIGTYKALFDDKFTFYGINPEWRQASLPSEHILLIKNNEKLPIMCNEFEKFCTLFETQQPNNVITFDMEAFEIGVSALISGYNVGELGFGNESGVFKVSFNYNNWENIKR
jgi:hypothetical protein